MTNKKIIEKIKQDKIDFIQLQFININGQLQSVEKPIHQINKIINNEVIIDGSSIKGYSDIATSDLFLAPDWSTYMFAKFLKNKTQKNIARVLCFILDNESRPFSGDPRNILSKIEEKYKKQNYILNAAFEAEFFLLKKDEKNQLIPIDNTGYFAVSPLDTADYIKREMVDTLEKHGFLVEAFHKEVANGQHEINYKYDTALNAADKIITFKWIIRTIAAKHNIIASFMPKPFKNINGSGLHTNISIFKNNKNLFYRNNNKKINENHHKFISGLINRAKEITSITNPTINSYKRLIPGFEAPNCIAWSDSNRTVMFRIPAAIKNSTRVEQRNVDPSSNPYLVLALIFEAGIESLNSEKQKLTPPTYENLFKKTRKQLQEMNIDLLPDSLGAALNLTSKSTFVKKILGEHAFTQFLKEKFQEWDEYRKIVHTWELKKYINY